MSDNEDAPVTRKPQRRKVAVSDSGDSDNEAAPVRAAVRRPVKKAAAADSDDDSSDEGDAPVVARPQTKHADPNEEESDDSDDSVEERLECPSYDYDAMTEQEFLDVLNAVSAKTRQKQIVHRDAGISEGSDGDDTGADVGQQHESHFDKSKAYTYSEMLDRVLGICRKNNPDLAVSQRIKLPMPKIERGGAKKTAFTNIAEVCKALGRTIEEVKDFIQKNLTTTSNIDSNNVLMIRVQNAKTGQFEKMLDKYVEQYCRCNACGGINTELARDHATRLQVLKCRVCQATRHIRTTEHAYKATTRAQRKKKRATML